MTPPENRHTRANEASNPPPAYIATALRAFACALSLAIATTGPATAQSSDFDPDTGYRISQFRSPTPASVPGGELIDIEDLQRLARDEHAILLDVLPSDGAGLDPSTGEWHMAKPHTHMPGSVWLPDVGKGQLSAALETYFKSNLERLTANDKSRPVIFYCQADCWMSWNATKRAASYGYTALYWYPAGIDGMRDWDIPLVPATPLPMPPTKP